MRGVRLPLGLVIASVLSLPCAHAADLETEAREILERRCLSCHGPKTKTAGLDLSNRDSALRGGSRGPAIKPGSPAESLLLERVLKGQMPPTGKLDAVEGEVLRRWIEAGLPWKDAIVEPRAGPDWWCRFPAGR